MINLNMNLVPLLQILTSAPSPSWRPSVWTTRSAATCRPSTSASASRASRGTGRWSAEVSPAVQCWFYCTRINAMQHTSINRSLQSFLTLYFLFSSSKSYLFLNELEHLTIYLCHYNFGWFPSTSTKKQPEEKSYYLLFSLQWLL